MAQMTWTRAEKDHASEEAAYAMRSAMAKVAIEHGLNHAEMINATAHVFASILAATYEREKDRDVVLSGLSDVIRAYVPQWQRIYAAEMDIAAKDRRASVPPATVAREVLHDGSNPVHLSFGIKVF